MSRALAHIETVSWIRPIEGADNIESIGILGWVLFAKKGEFNVGDKCVFFEIDSKLPEKEWCEFLASKHYKVKTYKLSKFNVISQGLALPIDIIPELSGKTLNVGDDVTNILGVKYSVKEDNYRKSSKISKEQKYNRMMAKHPNLAKMKITKWLMKRNWGKELLFIFFGRVKDEEMRFPKKFEFIHVTDEERCENLPQDFLQDKEPFIQTVKIDGTSSTYILEKKPLGRTEYYVCSRNIRQMDENQQTYHDDNVYWNMEFKYHIRDFLQDMLNKHKEWEYVCLQGETAGEGIQGNPHKLKGQMLFGFNFIDSVNGRWNSIEAADLCKLYNIPWVPIVRDDYILPDTMEELKLQADGKLSDNLEGASGLREGYVYRSQDGKKSFKNVSRQYLLHLKE